MVFTFVNNYLTLNSSCIFISISVFELLQYVVLVKF